MKPTSRASARRYCPDSWHDPFRLPASPADVTVSRYLTLLLRESKAIRWRELVSHSPRNAEPGGVAYGIALCLSCAVLASTSPSMKNKFFPALLLVTSLLVVSSSEAASNIISVLDSTPGSAGTANIAVNGPLAVSWTIAAGLTFEYFVFQAPLGFASFACGSASVSAFLTTQLGAGTTA